jgi:hypothetical protein
MLVYRRVHQLHHGSYWKGAPVFSPERKRFTTSMRSLVSQHGLGDLWRKSLDPFTKWMKKHFSTYRERYRYYIYIHIYIYTCNEIIYIYFAPTYIELYVHTYMHLWWYTWLYTRIWKVPRQLRTWQEHAQRSERRRSWKAALSQGNTLTSFEDQ